MREKRKGFTLSEILIAITIIGIIAAVTLPMITYQYKKAAVETKLKKGYSTLANAMSLSVAHNGHPEQWGLGDDNDAWAKQYLLPYIKVDNYCGKTQTGLCKFSAGYNNDTQKKVTKDFGSKYSRFYLNDGTQIAFIIDKNSSSDSVLFFIDIDGNQKGENKYGKDIFKFNVFTKIHNLRRKELFDKKTPILLMPDGYEYETSFLTDANQWNSCVKGKRGERCAALIMANGWKIPKDYPL
jgi:prepilin-type N-terminal cleavage/methylation domain-containing protein